MTYLLALIAGIAGAIVCFLAGAGVASVLAPMLAISSFAGASGYFVLVVGLLAGLAGFLAGVVLAGRLRSGRWSLTNSVKYLLVSIIVVAALVTGGIMLRLATLEHFSGPSPTLHFEIRLPEGMASPERRTVDFEMQAGSQRSGGQFVDDWLRQDGGRAVLRGLVPLYTRTSQRMLVVSLPDRPKLLFSIRLAATPKASESFGAWQRVDYLDDMKADSQPRRPTGTENYDIRLRVPDWQSPHIQNACDSGREQCAKAKD